jgi:hypothetical protein
VRVISKTEVLVNTLTSSEHLISFVQQRIPKNTPLVHWHQVPTLIGCLVFKERVLLSYKFGTISIYCQTRWLLTGAEAVFSTTSLPAEKRDYEAFLRACQINFAPTNTSHLAIIENREAQLKPPSHLSVTAKLLTTLPAPLRTAPVFCSITAAPPSPLL